ncbi:cell division protein ZipA [Pasteurella testudinis DSM 23072]|uniref:Cell division protein ZipA n=1 Tax=Pasteurella testudinis DSM 23072 TaxID=1122938 RepID=A0A1W1US66_9PAST|nr:cell division protein ZipA [Pasteurella testudinis]SMB83880.1 cell division protein ZipA [Pasteurella testudinis DSM 23072]SUB50955.1 cell division protein ZipA [Pasteurella testudinis]
MDLHIILIVLIILILVILVAHGLWSSRREKSQMFKSANTFTYDSRTDDAKKAEGVDLLDQHTPTAASNLPPQHSAVQTALEPEYAEPENTLSPQAPQPQVSVEQAVSNIRITLPQQAQQPQQSASAVMPNNSGAESLSRSALLNRTIADLEQEIDSEEGINTSSSILREELARATQQNKIILAEPAIENAPISPTTAAESVRAQLNPQPASQVTLPTAQAAQVAAETAKTEEAQVHAATPEKPKTLVLYVASSSNQGFQGVQVVQSLESLGFLFGQHSLYHRHLDLDSNSPILFSAANMMNPGIFDLDNLADFRTAGLVLFMHLPSPGNDLANFRLLLRAAQTLAEQLGGQVLNDKRQPFDQISKDYYLTLIS